MLEKKLNDWVKKVLTAHETPGATNTYQMIVDVDKIIAEAFDHECVLPENH